MSVRTFDLPETDSLTSGTTRANKTFAVCADAGFGRHVKSLNEPVCPQMRDKYLFGLRVLSVERPTNNGQLHENTGSPDFP